MDFLIEAHTAIVQPSRPAIYPPVFILSGNRASSPDCWFHHTVSPAALGGEHNTEHELKQMLRRSHGVAESELCQVIAPRPTGAHP